MEHPDKLALACRRALPNNWQHGAVVDTVQVNRNIAAQVRFNQLVALETEYLTNPRIMIVDGVVTVVSRTQPGRAPYQNPDLTDWQQSEWYQGKSWLNQQRQLAIAEQSESTQLLHNPPFDLYALLGLTEASTPVQVFSAHHLTLAWVNARYDRADREIDRLRDVPHTSEAWVSAQAWCAAYNGLFRVVEEAHSRLSQIIGSQRPK